MLLLEIMKLKQNILFSLSVSIFFLLCPLAVAQEQSASQKLEYQYLLTNQQNHWIRSSYRGNVMWEAYDLNGDGKPDEVIETVRIKNAKKVTQDTNFDGRDDVLTFIFKNKEYQFGDIDKNGTFDEFRITTKINHRSWVEQKTSVYKIAVPMTYTFAFEFLVDQLKRHNIPQKELNYVLGQTSEKYEVLKNIDEGGVFLLNSLYGSTEVWIRYPEKFKRKSSERNCASLSLTRIRWPMKAAWG